LLHHRPTLYALLEKLMAAAGEKTPVTLSQYRSPNQDNIVSVGVLRTV